MAVNVLKTYSAIHRENSYRLRDDIQSKIDALPNFEIEEIYKKTDYTAEEFFSKRDCAFPEFADARNSVRSYDTGKSIPLDDLIDAIRIASTVPSACDRQPARVHIITDREKVKKCLALQNGNRGFGQLTDKLLVVCGDLRTVLGAQEYFDLNTNVGIFSWNWEMFCQKKSLRYLIEK